MQHSSRHHVALTPLSTLNPSTLRLGTTGNVEINNKFHNPFIIGRPKRFYSFETVPYTKRTRFICLPTTYERNETQGFEEYKQRFEGCIMPPTDQESVRVTKILRNIIDALQREREKMSHESELPPSMSHLDGLNWEVLVVFLPYMSGRCFPNGKIVLSWELIRHFPSDAEKATIIAHEVAHAVARHIAEKFTKSRWFYAIHRMLQIFVNIDFEKRVSPLVDRLPFNQRFEFEADYIGVLLMAAAGYDPRVAPKVSEKMIKLNGTDNDFMRRGILGTHPSRIQRAKALARPKIMEEALILYNDARARSEVN